MTPEELYGTVEFKIYNNLPDVTIKNCEKFHTGILASHYFTKSWIKHSELNLIDFDNKLSLLMEKDKLKDSNWSPVTHIICFNTLSKEVYLVEIRLFRSLLEYYGKESFSILKRTFGRGIDFFLPRSVWWKSFITLDSNLNLTDSNNFIKTKIINDINFI